MLTQSNARLLNDFPSLSLDTASNGTGGGLAALAQNAWWILGMKMEC